MQKVILYILVFAESVAFAHPLSSALQALAKTRNELSTIAKQNSDDSWTKDRVDQMNQKLAEIWSEAMLLPITKSDSMIASLGYTIENDGSPVSNFEFKRNENASTLEKDENEFSTPRWKNFLELVKQQSIDLKEISTLMKDPQYSSAFSAAETKKIDRVVHSNRQELLKEAAQNTTTKIECMDYFNSMAQRSGLKLVILGNQVSWNAETLNRTYGVLNTEALSAEQKQQVKSKIEEMRQQGIRYEYACVPRVAQSFLRQEIKRLGGDQK